MNQPRRSASTPLHCISLQEKVQQERKKVALDVKELQRFVEQQERLLLGRLEKLDQEIVRRKEENLAKILEEMSSISEQIRELEEKCQQPPCEFLQVPITVSFETLLIQAQLIHIPVLDGHGVRPSNRASASNKMACLKIASLHTQRGHPNLCAFL